jgi:hypothetical protein
LLEILKDGTGEGKLQTRLYHIFPQRDPDLLGMNIDGADHVTMTTKGALIDLLRKFFQTIGGHLISSEKNLPKPGFTDRPVLAGLQRIKCSDPLIIGHGKDWALLDAFTTTGAAINLNHLFERKF